MKKNDAENNQKSEQGYSGLTITELENQLIKDDPESGIKNAFHALTRWGRLLVALALAVILIFGACYIQSLKKEINDLRSELNTLTNGISQEVHAVRNQSGAESRPDITQAGNTGQNQPGVAETQPPDDIIIHKVQEGDTLFAICIIYYGSEEFAPNLAALNNISPDSQLEVGQDIKVPENPYESWYDENR